MFVTVTSFYSFVNEAHMKKYQHIKIVNYGFKTTVCCMELFFQCLFFILFQGSVGAPGPIGPVGPSGARVRVF